MSKPGLTRKLTRLVRERPVDEKDLADAERYVRDWLGSYVAGHRSEPGAILLRYGAGRTDLESRVFLAAALSHVTETDDLHRGSTTHPGCVVVPTAYLLGLERSAESRAVLEAILVGYEVMLRVGESLGPGHYRTFHNTATAGVFGAAAAAADLLELDEDARVWALGNAGTQAAGLWQFNVDAAMSKHLHAGHAASAGLRAALLAAEGFTGAEKILEGEKGFYRSFCPDPVPEALLRESEGWKLPETSLKPYPSCRHTHPVIDSALEVRNRVTKDGLDPADLDGIRIATYDAALRLTDEPDPATPYAAKFSMQYCACVALLDGAPGLGAFDAGRITRDDVRELLARTEVTTDPEFDGAYPERWGGAVSLRTADGRRHEARRRTARGDPETPLTSADLDDKLRGLLVAGGMDEDEAVQLLDRCRALPDGGPLFALPEAATTAPRGSSPSSEKGERPRRG